MSLARQIIEADDGLGTTVRHPLGTPYGKNDRVDTIDSHEGDVPHADKLPDIGTSTGWEAAAREIAKNGAQRVDPATGKLLKRGGTLLDGFTANMLIKILDHPSLKPEVRAKFAGLPLMKAIKIGWTLVK